MSPTYCQTRVSCSLPPSRTPKARLGRVRRFGYDALEIGRLFSSQNLARDVIPPNRGQPSSRTLAPGYVTALSCRSAP
jgi:hypothetical protein